MNFFHRVREYVTPLNDKSQFFQSGVLTAKEFVEAGDFLVFKCPTWQWSSGDPTKTKDYLPKDKQYLVTRNVPCLQRCKEGLNSFPEHQEGDWTVYEDSEESVKNIPVDLDESSDEEEDAGTTTTTSNDSISDDGDFFDPEKDAILDEGNVIKSRTYDIYITWDKFYQTPRVWLFGYDEKRQPLDQDQMFEDVSPEHAKQTVTYEYHPHERYLCLSIHPCKHAHVMKMIISQRPENSVRADHYICLFLKFIGTVIPTISYDYSMTM